MRKITLFMVLLLFLSAGCDTEDQQAEFVAEAGAVPKGISRTDQDGNLIEEDPDDWRTSPRYLGVVRFDPAYPNPTRGEVVTIPFVVTTFNALPGGLRLRGYDNLRRFVLLDERLEASQPGLYLFRFSPSRLSTAGDINAIRGLHRVFVFDGRNELVSYGDILIE